ncbi:hypothetical protein IFR04_014862 [Cadophora malorum]|uniref:Bacteriophage T5 Orf172 DNA-binding domain-containing protein n=1 Tax=Cadophora malorum TaxID=108018 RepID=A0A8H7VZ35_9HELO|nr:hypothetical protein IFR04_014862 [Cadophora malorum]
MSPSYPSPPSTPSPVRGEIDRHLEHQNQHSPTRAINYAALSPPTSPPITDSKNESAAAVAAVAVAAPMDPTDLKELLGLRNGKCGCPTKRKGNPPCTNPNPSNIENQIDSMTTLTQTSPELLDQLEKLAVLAFCNHHIKAEPRAARIKLWKKVFPIGDEKAVPIEPIGDQIISALDCFPYTARYTCVGTRLDRDSTTCGFSIGGKRVRKGKRTFSLIIRPENYLNDHNLTFLLDVLASNIFCYNHTEQIPDWVAKQKACITKIFRAYPVEDHQLSSAGNTGLSRKLEGSPEEFWDNADDTSAFITEIEEDRPSNASACFELVRDKMKEPLKKPELGNGYVYVYGVEGNEGFVKIGFTSDTIKGRLDGWKAQCDREPKLLYPLGSAEKIPHANRVEGLCLAELNYRHMTVICESCPKRHIEWVQVSAAEAIAVIQKWTKWIDTVPYKDSKKPLTTWELRRKITSWELRHEEEQRTDDMPKFMQEVAAASLLAEKQSSTEASEAVRE